MANLKDRYIKEGIPNLMTALGIRNMMRVPRITKVVVNMGMGVKDKDVLKAHVDALMRITGQRPVVTRSRKSISNFKLREGMDLGAKVTLRGDRMYEFLERLIQAALPRIRDFRGVSPAAFDGRGNYTMGIKEQTIFPEIDPNTVSDVQGMDITIVTSAPNDKEALELLKQFGMPFAAR